MTDEAPVASEWLGERVDARQVRDQWSDRVQRCGVEIAIPTLKA